MRPNTYELWRGPSELDGQPIVVLASGFARGSKNTKTGAMIQTWILRQDVAPHEAARNGEDASICGDCPLRYRDGHRGCYVIVHQGPLSVWKAWKRGNVPRVAIKAVRGIAAGRALRMGSYGDPAAAPFGLWYNLMQGTTAHTGYTHQWRTCEGNFKSILMASVSDAPHEQEHAVTAGWRTFKVAAVGQLDPQPFEVVCPATTRGVQCADCGLCMGASKQAKCVVIEAHGNGKRHVA
jgi:hypothetical protein